MRFISMDICTLTAAYRPEVDRYIRDEWGGPMLVTRGNLFDSRDLPGFVAVEDDALLGAALYAIRGDECEIATLFSLQPNRGAGNALIQAVLDKAREARCRRVWLITTNDDTHAIRFYQRRGFTLKAVHLNAFELTKKLKPGLEGIVGIDGIPILHEFEFEIVL